MNSQFQSEIKLPLVIIHSSANHIWAALFLPPITSGPCSPEVTHLLWEGCVNIPYYHDNR